MLIATPIPSPTDTTLVARTEADVARNWAGSTSRVSSVFVPSWWGVRGERVLL